MKQCDTIVLTDAAVFPCVAQRAIAGMIVDTARDATIYHARGRGVRERPGLIGLAVEAEKHAITIVVATGEVERIIGIMYIAGKLDTPGMSLICVTPFAEVATHIPEEIAGRRLGDQVEKAIVTVMVDGARADTVFEFTIAIPRSTGRMAFSGTGRRSAARVISRCRICRRSNNALPRLRPRGRASVPEHTCSHVTD